MITKETENRINELFGKLVPTMGKCETLGGEILRAVCKIWYRYYNDGDKMREGYGCETVNPPVRFLGCVCDDTEVTPRFTEAVDDLYNREPYSESDEEYELKIDNLAEAALELVEVLKLSEVPNSFGDMLEYVDPDEDKDPYEEDEDEDDEYGDEYDWDEDEDGYEYDE